VGHIMPHAKIWGLEKIRVCGKNSFSLSQNTKIVASARKIN